VPLEQYVYFCAVIKDGEFTEDLNKLFHGYPKDSAVRQKLAEIFILQCDFTGKITHPSSVTNFRAQKTLKPTLAQQDNLSKKN